MRPARTAAPDGPWPCPRFGGAPGCGGGSTSGWLVRRRGGHAVLSVRRRVVMLLLSSSCRCCCRRVVVVVVSLTVVGAAAARRVVVVLSSVCRRCVTSWRQVERFSTWIVSCWSACAVSVRVLGVVVVAAVVVSGCRRRSVAAGRELQSRRAVRSVLACVHRWVVVCCRVCGHGAGWCAGRVDGVPVGSVRDGLEATGEIRQLDRSGRGGWLGVGRGGITFPRRRAAGPSVVPEREGRRR